MKIILSTLIILSSHRPDVLSTPASSANWRSQLEAWGLLHLPTVFSPKIMTVDADGEDEIDYDDTILIEGRHRIEALRSLGISKIPCHVIDTSKADAELLEIAENLHRAELTQLQRSEQVARWITH